MKTFCCGCNLRHGSIACAIYTMVDSTLGFLFSFMSLGLLEQPTATTKTDTFYRYYSSGYLRKKIPASFEDSCMPIVKIDVVIHCIIFLSSLLLIIGVTKKVASLLLPWIVVMAIKIGLCALLITALIILLVVLALVVLVLIIFVNLGWLDFLAGLGLSLGLILVIAILAGFLRFLIYCFTCVTFLRNEYLLKEENDRAQDRLGAAGSAIYPVRIEEGLRMSNHDVQIEEGLRMSIHDDQIEEGLMISNRDEQRITTPANMNTLGQRLVNVSVYVGKT